ncbi:MAG: pyridoxamine 5'-phosphate oxidase family protein [Luteolibacter sp.]|uniref:pyridoxamine 5'-phosphate oxidase family protein n=1 Tax=Luteolibacter sp. TaxID=1962973 RepID=UPI003266F0AD
MSTTQNLTGKEAIDKLRSLTENTPTCMFGSGLHVIPFHLCPMEVQQVDHQGCLWLFSGADSVHNRHIAADARVHLIFSNPSKIEYLTVFGEAAIFIDPTKAEELWSKLVEAWFPGGPDDPNLTLIRVRPVMSHFWDTENGMLTTFAKVLTSAITGSGADEGGVEGKLTV